MTAEEKKAKGKELRALVSSWILINVIVLICSHVLLLDLAVHVNLALIPSLKMVWRNLQQGWRSTILQDH